MSVPISNSETLHTFPLTSPRTSQVVGANASAPAVRNLPRDTHALSQLKRPAHIICGIEKRLNQPASALRRTQTPDQTRPSSFPLVCFWTTTTPAAAIKISMGSCHSAAPFA